MRIISDYMRDDALRHELNALTEKTFGFSFEDWVTAGYFEGDYIPYSLEEDGIIISNVSANIMRFSLNGETKSFVQLGTVMTDEQYRRRGCARRLMEHVIGIYEGKYDGIYLFGNLTARGFYRKMGFHELHEHRYTMKSGAVGRAGAGGFEPVSPDDEVLKRRYLDFVRNGAAYSAFEQINRYALQMFYTAGLDSVYYSPALDCFAVMRLEGGTLELQSVVSTDKLPLENIIARIGTEYGALRLGFVPLPEDSNLFTAGEYDGGEDYRLFCRGEGLNIIEKDRLFFPVLSHA